MDKTAERNRRRRERVLERYKIGYCMPYCIAFVNGSEDMDKLLTRCIDFKMGVVMADSRYPKWSEKFNDVYHECMKIVTGEVVQKECMNENENVPFDQMPQLHTGSFLTKEQAEQFKDTFKNLTVVVRCKDCKYKEESVSPSWEAWCNRLHCGCDNDWFCADGERKEGR